MSAIVRGLRRTFRDKNQRQPGYDPKVAAVVRERRLAREAAPKPTFKILRGKKDVTESPYPEPKTRRARFLDPEDNFGKKSLVYRMKSGEFDRELAEIEQKKPSGRDNWKISSRGDGHRTNDRDFPRKDSRQNSYGRSTATRGRSVVRGFRNDDAPTWKATGRREGRGGGFGDEKNNMERNERVEGRGVRDNWADKFGRNDRFGGRTFDRDDRSGNRQFDRAPPRERRRDDDRSERFGEGRRNNNDNNDRPGSTDTGTTLGIPYTTAASQFLYGRSVVEAALRSGRRKLYKLYIYAGANRGHAGDDFDINIERLARRQNVTVKVVDEQWQRTLDRMSKGRPHNGYILEASPLPQQPLKALGPYTDGQTAQASSTAPAVPAEEGAYESEVGLNTTSDVPGFSIEVGFQSREDAAVNGSSTFVKTASSRNDSKRHRPLVLVLDQVLDPGNLGGILRSASYLGVSAVVVSRHGSAAMSPVVLKASAGAAESLPLFTVDVPADFLAASRKAGWKVYTAVVPGNSATKYRNKRPVLDLDELEAKDPLQESPCILVMGSEGEGLPRTILRQADAEVTIGNQSGSDVVDSLNVSVASGLLCASFLRGSTRKTSSSSSQSEGASDDAVAEAVEEKKVADELGIW